MTDSLFMWVVYERPTDYPEHFVARCWRYLPTPLASTTDVLQADSLEQLRDQLPPGLLCLARDPSDDPVIVEVWI